jgi:hypothetical protein
MRVIGLWTATEDCKVKIQSAKTLVRGPKRGSVLPELVTVGTTLELKKGEDIFCVEFEIEVIYVGEAPHRP